MYSPAAGSKLNDSYSVRMDNPGLDRGSMQMAGDAAWKFAVISSLLLLLVRSIHPNLKISAGT